MESIIKPVTKELYPETVQIFAEAFEDDPLFLFAFPEIRQRQRLTRIMYEFVVLDMVPKLNLELKGAFINNNMAGCIIYTSPESFEWNEIMNDPLTKMREKASDERIDIIGEYARLVKYNPGVVHFYGNELAVSKRYRGIGVGKALNDSMVIECKKHSEAVGIVIDTANGNNVERYKKWGWELKASGKFYNIGYFAFWMDC